MAIVVNNRVRVPMRDLRQEELEQIRDAFTYENPEYVDWKRKRLMSAAPPRFVGTWEHDATSITVPRGGLERVCAILGRRDVFSDVTQGSLSGEWGFGPHLRQPWDFQRAMVEHVVRHEVCCLRAPPAAGKTTAAIAIASHLRLPTLVLVWTEALLKQWVERCVDELGCDAREIGIIQGTKRRVTHLTVGMVQTLANCAEQYSDVFGLVICDELQRFGAESFRSVIDQFSARYRVGVSADERRRDRKEFLIYDEFGTVAFEVKKKDLLASGRIVDVKVVVVPTGWDDPDYRKVVERSHFNKHLRRHVTEARVRMVTKMTEDEGRNRIVGEIARRHAADGGRVVALSDRREHCSILAAEFDRATGGRGGILLGGKGQHAGEYDRAKRGLRDGSVLAAAATYQAFGTGVDVPALDVGILATPKATDAKGKMQMDQFLGRFARAAEGKTGAVAYYLWDAELFGKKPLKLLASWYPSAVVMHEGREVPLKEFLKESRKKNANPIPSHEARTPAVTRNFFDDVGAPAEPARKLRSRSDVRR